MKIVLSLTQKQAKNFRKESTKIKIMALKIKLNEFSVKNT